jgi:hypothetical protein
MKLTDQRLDEINNLNRRCCVLNPKWKSIHHIIDDDLEWNLRIISALTDLTLNSLGQNFNTNSKYDERLDIKQILPRVEIQDQFYKKSRWFFR